MMIKLIQQRPTEHITDFPSLSDLHELLAVDAVRNRTHLWYDRDGELAGFAIPQESWKGTSSLIWEATPEAKAMLLKPMLDVAASLADQCTFSIHTSCREDDQVQMRLLQAHGFKLVGAPTWHLARSLEMPIPLPTLAAGFSIRPLAGEVEVSKWVQLHQAAWGTKQMTEAYKLSMMSGADYEPALDLVAVAPNGRLVAYCVCWIDQDENRLTGQEVGYADPVSTHPYFQQRGLAKALLLTGLRLLQGRGVETARLSTSEKNVAMRCTAKATDFDLTHRTLQLERPIGVSNYV